ncbi:MAG: FGGY-family carbohydrate kinase [Rhodococcus sp. (in: high G+C Gram-positive bacteria)]
MLVYAVDLGTTNTKVVLYDEGLRRLSLASAPAVYEQVGDKVEFSAESLFETMLELIGQCARSFGDTAGSEATIVLTGQAESLVLNDRHGDPVRPALSWLDDRAMTEAAEMADHFGADGAFAITGEPFPSATWPAAKLRWLAKNEPDVIERSDSVLMVKDELIRRLTGSAVGEATTRGFTYFYDVPNGRYWNDMLDFISVPRSSLPEVVAAGTDLGPITPTVRDQLPPAAGYRVNSGALDHFCAMVGTNSYSPDVVSESAGTVLSLSLLARNWTFDVQRKVSFHNGLNADETVLFNGVDSGGVALEWYRRELLDGMPFAELEGQLVSRVGRSAPIFMPYLTGVNPPDFFPDAQGAFLGLKLGHDRIDMAFAVHEGISHLLRRNVDYMTLGVAQEIVSSGGGAASKFWNQLKADTCAVELLVPDEPEATCRGAAILALIAAGSLGSADDARTMNPPPITRYRPSASAERAERYELFESYLDRLYRNT